MPTPLSYEDMEARRATLSDVLVRALECLAQASMARGEAELATAHAREVVRLEPFRESGYRLLMTVPPCLAPSAKWYRNSQS